LLAKRSEQYKNSISITKDCLGAINHGGEQVMKKETTVVHNTSATILHALEGKTVQLTTITIDIVNSSENTKRLPSELVGEYYRAFIESVSDLIQEHGGFVLKNVGDCVIGFFLSSEYFLENHDKAVLCGLTMHDMIIHSLNPYLVKKKLPSIEYRISADFGTAKVIRVNSNGEYSAIDLFGDAMNSASKILQYAKPNQMVIGDKLFWKLINNSMTSFDFKLINRFNLTGKHSYPVYLVQHKQ
jgi:class 3 adenylate cyclase